MNGRPLNVHDWKFGQCRCGGSQGGCQEGWRGGRREGWRRVGGGLEDARRGARAGPTESPVVPQSHSGQTSQLSKDRLSPNPDLNIFAKALAIFLSSKIILPRYSRCRNHQISKTCSIWTKQATTELLTCWFQKSIEERREKMSI